MTDTSAANLELAIVLPLGVIANQLMRIEADLRFLNMKALAVIDERDGGALDGQIAARLDKINEALDLIRGLMADLQADLQPRPRAIGRVHGLERVSGKPLPERDD